MIRLARATTAALLLCLTPGLAYSHAHLNRAEPPVGGTVRTAPAQVEITFSAAVEPRFSSIAVADGAGAAVDKHDVHLVGGDAHRLAVSLGALRPGTYKVTWQATSVDTHRTEGAFDFTVAP
jgi:methionine-rich copper-binding protein CopC